MAATDDTLLAASVDSGILDAEDLMQLLASGLRVRLVDCRFNLADIDAGLHAYDAGHLPGAVFADLERDLSGPIVRGTTGRHPLPDVKILSERLSAWGVDERTLVVAYDDGSCMFAPRLWWLLRWLGHERVTVLRGGLTAWQNAGNPLSQLEPAITPVAFEARPNSALLAGLQEVAAIAADPTGSATDDTVLLDARGDVRYRGEQEPIDPVAGHIPTAKNLPYTSLVASGAPRSEAEVQAAFAAAVDAPALQVVAYCGSGVTACALIWAAASAGLTGIRLYPGSWSEWITDPTRPIALGAK
jgi:thiosulfate/3-mercaptopyruvate sulfurtransferase